MTEEQSNSDSKRWWHIFKKPSTIIIGSIAVACGVIGYVGTRWLVTEKLPPFLEQQLSKTFERPIDLGEVESFSLNSITFDESTISVNDDDPDYAVIDRVKVGFNIFPVIFRQVLPLEVTLVDPDLYLEQNKNGTWLELPGSSDEGGGLPIDFDITVLVESGEVALLPNDRQQLINLKLDGKINYDQTQPQYIRYDLDTKVGDGVAKAEGKTSIETGETKTQILVQDLSLPKVIPLLPNELPVNLQQGQLNANLDVNIPSFAEIDNTQVRGRLSLQQVKAEAEQLDKPIKGRSRLNFNGDRVKVNKTQASIGNIAANVDGRINWKTGYDVNIVVPPFAVNKLLNIVPADSPVDVAGKVKANLQLTGAITEPLLKGTVSNTQPVMVAKTKLDKLEAELTASLDKVVLEDLSIIPAAGGEITGRGLIGSNSNKISGDPTPLSLQFQAQLPAEELLKPYYGSSVPFNVGIITAIAKVDGTVAKPKVLVDWQAPTVTTSAKTDVSGSGSVLFNNSILTVRDTKLEIDSGELNLSGTGNLANNNWQAILTANNVPLNPFLQPLSEQLKLEEPITLEDGTVRLNGKLTPSLDTLDGIANLNLDVGSGDVSVKSELNSGNLNVKANAIDVPVNDFITGVVSEPVDAQVNFSANLESIEKTIAIDANNIAVQLEEQSLNAEGEIFLTDLATSLDANVDLDIQADSNLDTLPNQLLNNLATNNQFFAKNFNLAGNASFNGRLQGQDLLSTPNNLDLTGDLQLEDFAVANTAFDRILLGTVNISPEEQLSINLEGQQDVIAAEFEPCQTEQCPFPYLPTSIRLRQGEKTPEPIVAIANREGEFLDVDVKNFPLSLLNISPAANLGFTKALKGEVTGKALVNLFTFATTAEVQVIEPSVGYIDGEAITADFAYSPEQNLARLDSATLKFGESIYNLEGEYNLQTQEITGELDIPQAYVQDLISTFGWYDIKRVTELFKTPDLAKAEALSTLEVGDKDARVGDLLKLLVIVTERLQEVAEDSDLLATPLDIKGAYTGEIMIAGSLDSPNVAWKVSGDDWLWDTSRNVVFEIPRQPGIVAINKLLVEGNYNNQAITLDSFLVQGAQAVIALEGKLKGERVTADYKIQDLPIDAIDNFIDIPVDLAGRISTTGKASQSLPTPKLVGDVALTNGRLSDRNLPQITGKYVYNNARLELDTTETPSAQIQASIPFPIKSGNDFVSLTADLDEGGIALIDGFTDGAIEFIGGDADITLNANARLDLDRDFIFQDLDAVGNITLNNTVLKTAAFTEPLDVTGKIVLDEGLLQVEQLSGTLAKSNITASGVLPLLEPRENINDPLTLTIYKSEIDLDQLYKGGIEGEVIITGDAFSPLIAGEVELFDGQGFIPKDEEETDLNNAIADTDPESAFKPQLTDFEVVLADFKFQQMPLYKFVVNGDLILNGAANNVPEIKADGTLQVQQGDVDFVSNQFNLKQDYENTIVFDPKKTILNPFVDVRLQTEVSNLDNIDLGVVDDNEIPDPISQAGRNEIVNVILAIEGETEQIIPRINEDSANCGIEPPLEPLFADEIYTKTELNQLAECVNFNAFEEGTVKELLNSPAVNLESNPPRSQGAILSLLGNRFIGLVEQLQDSNEEQLLEFGVTQFVFTPIEREIFNFADKTINNIGEKIGLDYLRVYPAVEGTYQLSNDSSVNATYDYFFNEVKVRYQKQF